MAGICMYVHIFVMDFLKYIIMIYLVPHVFLFVGMIIIIMIWCRIKLSQLLKIPGSSSLIMPSSNSSNKIVITTYSAMDLFCVCPPIFLYLKFLFLRNKAWLDLEKRLRKVQSSVSSFSFNLSGYTVHLFFS